MGSLTTRTYAVILASSFCTRGTPRPSHGTLKSLRSSQNRVNPQSPSSALNRCVATTFRSAKIATASSLGIRTVRDVDGWVVYVGQNQSELNASVPVCWRFVFPGMLQVKGCVFDMITVRKEEDSPMNRCQSQLVGSKRQDGAPTKESRRTGRPGRVPSS